MKKQTPTELVFCEHQGLSYAGLVLVLVNGCKIVKYAGASKVARWHCVLKSKKHRPGLQKVQYFLSDLLHGQLPAQFIESTEADAFIKLVRAQHKALKVSNYLRKDPLWKTLIIMAILT